MKNPRSSGELKEYHKKHPHSGSLNLPIGIIPLWCMAGPLLRNLVTPSLPLGQMQTTALNILEWLQLANRWRSPLSVQSCCSPTLSWFSVYWFYARDFPAEHGFALCLSQNFYTFSVPRSTALTATLLVHSVWFLTPSRAAWSGVLGPTLTWFLSLWFGWYL